MDLAAWRGGMLVHVDHGIAAAVNIFLRRTSWPERGLSLAEAAH
jgi:hypothetical protein